MTVVRLIRALVLVALLLAFARAIRRAGCTVDVATIRHVIEHAAQHVEHAIGLR